MELVPDQESTISQFLLLEENLVLPWSGLSQHVVSLSWYRQREGTIGPVANKARDGICTVEFRVGVADLRNYYTRFAKQSNVLAFCRTISFSINVNIT